MKTVPVFAAIFFGVLCMSTSSIMIRWCSAPALIIALYRLVATTVLALAWKRKNIAAMARISRRDMALMAVSGLFLALHLAFWISSLSYTSISSSVLFTNLQVIFVLFFSALFLREGLKRWAIVGVLAALTGSGLIAGGDLGHGKLLGDMMALASGLFVAVYLLIGRQVRARVEILDYTVVVSSVAAVVILATALLANLPLSGYPAVDWLLFLLMGLGPGLGGHAVLNWALKFVKAPLVAVSILGESVMASILGWIIFHEALLWYQLAGGGLILTGIYLAAVNESK
jgi:drug/metabolite transporter (DMT)-like permease